MRKAIVIGVEQYNQLESGLPARTVPGAVADALAFYQWLIDDQKLAEDEIALHLEPASAHPRAKPAAQRDILESIDELCAKEDQGKHQRIYFYFVGHGFQFGSDLSNDPELALVFSGFRNLRTGMRETVRFDELRAVVDGLGPGYRYFFVDCCQTVLTDSQLSGGSLGINQARDVRSKIPNGRHTLFSTQPGRAAAAANVGQDRSAFSRAVLDGLRGVGAAKQWDVETPNRLVVTFQSLQRFVSARLADEEAQLVPFQDYGPGPADVLLAFQPPKPVHFSLTVTGAPPDAALSAIMDAYGMQRRISLAQGRAEEDVPPNKYQVMVEGMPYTFKPALQSVSLFEDRAVSFSCEAPDPTLQFANGALGGSAGLRGGAPSSAHVARAASLNPVEVRFELPLGRYRGWIEDEVGRKKLALDPEAAAPPRTSLVPGSYRVVIEEAGRISFRQPFEVAPGRPAVVNLSPPPPSEPAGPENLFHAQVGHHNGWVQPSESLGAVADSSLEMILALLAGEAAWPGHHKLAALGLPVPSFRNVAGGRAGLLVLLATDGPGRLAAPNAGLTPASPVPGLPGVLASGAEAAAGAVVVAWKTARHHRAMPIALVPNRLSCLIVSSRSGAREVAHVLLLPLQHLAAAFPPDELPTQDLPPLQAIRYVINGQRAYAQGQTFGGAPAGFVDPILQLLAGHAALGRGEEEAARDAGAQMRARWPGLADTRALLAALESGPGLGAVLGGIPMLARGAAALFGPGDIPGAPAGGRLVLESPWTQWALP